MELTKQFSDFDSPITLKISKIESHSLEEYERLNESWGLKRKNEYICSRTQLAQLSGISHWSLVQLLNYSKLQNDSNYYSISHTKEVCACAQSQLMIGVDIEHAQREIPKDSESHFLNENDDHHDNSLLELWCIKEACFKAAFEYSPKLLKEITISNKQFFFDNTLIGSYNLYQINEYLVCLAQVNNELHKK